MTPTLPVGAIILVQPCQAADLTCGEIVCLETDGRPLVHRFLRTESGPSGVVVVTQGDRNPVPDPPHLPAAVLGRVERAYWGWLPIPLRHRLATVVLRSLSRVWPWTAPARGVRRAVVRVLARRPRRPRR